MQIAVDRLTELGQAIVLLGGAAAAQVTHYLIDANLAGHDSHGIGMLPAYMLGIREGALVPGAEISVENDRGPFLLIDGNAGFGQVIAKQAMELAIARAKDLGIAVMGLKNSYHIGRVGAWGEMAAAEGFISIHYVNAHSPNSLVAPHGGTDSRFTTNPYCTALPATNGPPVVLDMATSKVAMGKVRVAHNKGVEVPPDCLIDHMGNPTNDPGVMFAEPKGALRSMGLHKGYALAVICEALAGGFTGGGTFGPDRVGPGKIINNMLTVLIDPDAFGQRAAFEAEIDRFTEWVKTSPPAPGVDEVMVPGDPERKARADRLANGVPVDERTFEELLETCELVGLSRDQALRIVGN
ncbi:MAG: malate/lactate/ureidoglycolate dehydrogenase [Alphaproteobacteria bacterium]|nr:malate/lactate/ureidoglycolate dehydrogenase [Alphaproteobacteria bacterium]